MPQAPTPASRSPTLSPKDPIDANVRQPASVPESEGGEPGATRGSEAGDLRGSELGILRGSKPGVSRPSEPGDSGTAESAGVEVLASGAGSESSPGRNIADGGRSAAGPGGDFPGGTEPPPLKLAGPGLVTPEQRGPPPLKLAGPEVAIPGRPQPPILNTSGPAGSIPSQIAPPNLRLASLEGAFHTPAPKPARPGGPFSGETEPPAVKPADSSVAYRRETPDVSGLPVAAPLLGTAPETERPLGRPPLKPRAPYNPLARTRPQISTPFSEQSGSTQASSAPVGPLSNPPESAQRTAETHVVSVSAHAHAVSITGRRYAPADVGIVATNPSSEAGSGVQRSPEPGNNSPDLPAILSLLLPAEEKRIPQAIPDVLKRPFQIASEGAPSAALEAQGGSHVAALDWARGGLRAESLPAHIRTALERYNEQNGTTQPSLAAQRVAKRELREDDTCCVYFERPKNAALVPCGHRLCFECSTLVRGKRGDCPLCNTRIQSVLKLFN